MRTKPAARRVQTRLLRAPDKDTAILILPPQNGDAIRRRRQIRETLHDSKAVTIRRRPRQPR